jgi:hypothetical protein
MENRVARMEEPFPGTPFFETIDKSFDYYGDQPVQVSELRQAASRKPKEVFYLPALAPLGIVLWLQLGRRAHLMVHFPGSGCSAL